MELLNGFTSRYRCPCRRAFPSFAKVTAVFFLILLLGQHVASMRFNEKLAKMLKEPSQHGKRMPRWNPDPETRNRVRRALADTKIRTENEDNSDEYEDYYQTTENCSDRLRFDFEDVFRNAYEGPVCDVVDARNNADQLKDLENCVIVNGFVQLLFMHELTEEDFKRYRFPKLRVITDYLLVFRLFNLRSLRYMFPNLAVIGGRELFRDYAIVLFENPNLKEIGLGNLQFIKRGGVRIEKNPMLCYLSTINWERLGQGGDVDNKILPNAVDLIENRCEDQCVNQCGGSAGCDKEDGRELCWGLNLCQKKLCPKECPDSCHEDGSCGCHTQCLGGCTRKNDSTACISCRHKYDEGTCVSECPAGKYLIFNWLCIEKSVCQGYNWFFLDNECLRECPPGYKANSTDCMNLCTKCTSDCGLVCVGDVAITDVDSLTVVKQCSEITGALTIAINGGSEVVERLDKDLKNLKQIGTLIVRRSFPLVTLSFLKNVKRITGNSMEQEIYSFYILENQNLKELWNFTEGKIDKGKSFFHFNPQLCLQEIRQVELLTPETEDNKDISDTTNGDKAICHIVPIKVLETQVFSREPLVRIRWENFVVKDFRTLIGYQIYYKESPQKNAKKNEGVDACRLNSWTVVDKAKSEEGDKNASTVEESFVNGTSDNSTIHPGNTSKVLSHLKAYTQYAFYVQAYTTSTAESGAASEMQYFTTNPARPTQPKNLRSTGTTTNSIVIEWDPPSHPNGEITHYIVEWRRQKEEDLDSVRAVDTCKHGYGKVLRKTPTQPKPEATSSQQKTALETVAEAECNCDICDDDHLSNEAKIETQESSDFENYLQDRLFTTGPRFIEEMPDNSIRFPSESEDYEAGLYEGGGDLNYTRRRRSIVKRSNEELVNISAIANSTTVPPSRTTSRVSSTMSVQNQTTPDPRFKKIRSVVLGERTFTLTDLHHYSEYSIQVYACNHASDPRTKNDSTFNLKDDIPQYDTVKHMSKYVKCSIEALAMKRTSPNKSADVIPPKSVKIVAQNKGTAEEVTTLYWGMPEYPNAYVRTFTVEVSSAESGKETSFCVHVNSSVKSIVSFNFSEARLSPGKYNARIRAISLAGEGNWTASASFEERDPTQSYHQTIITIIVIVAVIIILVIVGLVAYIRTRRKLPDLHGFYTDYNPEYQRYVYTADEYEVDVENVTILEEIGHGNFGKVFAGIAKSVVKGEAETKVAIKKLHENAMPARRYEFLKEASMMKAFNAHHVVRLLGVISKIPDPMVIMEFMEKGDLKSYLRSRRESAEENPQHLPPPTLQEKLQMAAEIADGMAYLAAFKFVHRDLAARNCLVNAACTVKIGDFGLTRDIYETDYYRKESRGFLPIRWMAPESLKDGIFDSRSDIWSYGVVLWELASLAEQPYCGLPHDEVTRFVIDGGYMEKPRNCPKRLYDLMTYCWQYNPKMRPIFLEIVQELYRDVSDEFKEVCFFGKNDQASPVEEEEGQYLLSLEHSDGTDTVNLPNLSRLGDHTQENNILPPSSGSVGNRNNFLHHKNSMKSRETTSTPPKPGSEDRWLLAADPPHPTRNIESPNTTSTTAPTTPTSNGDRRTARNRNSSESLYENDLGSDESRDPNLSDSGAFIFMSGPSFNGDKDPLVSYKHLNGGHKHTVDLDLDHESGVDDSSTVSPSNPSTPTEMEMMTFGGQNDETTAFLRPTASSNC